MGPGYISKFPATHQNIAGPKLGYSNLGAPLRSAPPLCQYASLIRPAFLRWAPGVGPRKYPPPPLVGVGRGGPGPGKYYAVAGGISKYGDSAHVYVYLGDPRRSAPPHRPCDSCEPPLLFQFGFVGGCRPKETLGNLGDIPQNMAYSSSGYANLGGP